LTLVPGAPKVVSVDWSPPKPDLEASPRIVRALSRLAFVAAGVTAVIGVLALVGWATDSAWLKDPVQGFSTMKPNTALMLILSSIALGILVQPPAGWRVAGFAIAGASAALALAVLAQDALGRDLGVDTILVHLPSLRPSVPTTLSILLLDVALLLLDVRGTAGPSASQLLAAISGVLASLALGGFAYGAIQFYDWRPFPHGHTMAVNTSVSILALASGVMAARPRSGVMATFSSPHVGGQVVRKMLAIALVIPVIGFISARLQVAGVFRSPTATVVEAVTGMAVAAVIAFAVAHSLERTDARRRQVELESREWKRFFDRAAFGAGFGTIDGRFGLVNEAFARMHGYTVDELEGRPIAVVFPPELHPELAEKIRLTHKSGKCIWKTEHVRKDGARFPVLLDCSAVRSETGELLYRAVYIRDISEERAAEAVRSRLASLVQSAEDAITTESLDGTLLDWNQGAERIFGYKAQEVVGGPVNRLVPEGLQAERKALVARALEGETIAGFETERVGKDGQTLPVAVTLSPIRGESGDVVGLSSIVRDISALKTLEREREEWSSIVAHDLRQPASTIRLTASTMARQDPGPTTKRALERIRGASDQLECMIGDLLDVSRIDSHRFRVRPHAQHLVPLLRDGIEATPACAERCRMQVTADSDTAIVDGQRFVQVLSNLLSNAAKYGYPGTPIEVELSRRDEMLEVTVTNEGPGIAPDEASRLFSRFARTRGAERGDTPGLGLGLYICRGIIDAHGGQLWVESEPGERTHFRFTLPYAVMS
jgi:PAS domain S-box-containing protein